MCLKFKSTAKRIPLTSLFPYNVHISTDPAPARRLTLRAIRIDHNRMPNMNPLYWKWMWSTIRKPGWRNRAADIILWTDGSTEPRINLKREGQYEWNEAIYSLTREPRSQVRVLSGWLLLADMRQRSSCRSSDCSDRQSWGQQVGQILTGISQSRRRTEGSRVLQCREPLVDHSIRRTHSIQT